ncbi:MAG: hypothetical protein AAB600_05475 [Patescibacteria group bacterium]
MIVFKYKEEITSRKQKIIRPVAEVYLKTLSNSWIKFYPYIDSGADITLIPLSLGKLLGFKIDESKVQQIGGIRGSVPVIFTQAFLKIGNEEFPTNLAWALIEDVPPLLGRTDVFDIFKVTFEQYKEVIIFEKH